jgi:extracellular elastinolytic metalloproteinase
MRRLPAFLLPVLAAGLLLVPGSALSTRAVAGDAFGGTGLGDLDTRTGQTAPTAAQRAQVAQLGAMARWTRFGTPASLTKSSGWLAQGLGGSAADAARSFIRDNRELFKLSDAAVSGLAVVNDAKLAGTDAHAVLFRQSFGSLAAAQDGMIAVAVHDGKIAYVSSSAVGDAAAPGAATLSAIDAWKVAAADAGLNVSSVAVNDVQQQNGGVSFAASGLGQRQYAKLVAFPTSAHGARAAWEVDVIDVGTPGIQAYIDFVDAQNGKLLFRQNAVEQDAQPQSQPFSGEYTATGCGPGHDFTVESGTTTIDVAATATLPTNDIVLHLQHPRGVDVGSSDTATSPEAIHYAPGGSVDPGVYTVQVCPYPDPTVPALPPFTYAGTFITTGVQVPTLPVPVVPALPGPVLDVFSPQWKFFLANPLTSYSSSDVRTVACWDASKRPGCDLVVKNDAAKIPWDQDPRTNEPTGTTTGNAAKTAQAWASPLTPAENLQYVSPNREYSPAWTNQWYSSKCNPAVFALPQRADVDASIVNLFAVHNRMHDFSYRLGFTETNYNMQQSNFGKTAQGPYPVGREGDPELGDAQAGAVTGGNPSFLGRDNANQITLQDGIPGITNQYLFQPIAGAFYGPCVDGGLDMSVVGHEYTHAISNRMVGGPDANLTGLQAGAMGESWSDLDAQEYMHEYNWLQTGAGVNEWAVGVYATGNPTVGIRDYALNDNPLNYSDVGFDLTGPEVHADGEIWNAVNYDLRQALVEKYDGQFPSSDHALQLACAEGQKPVTQCPGNRRWIQLVYDAWLLMQPSVTMLDARDAFLAADRVRFDGADTALLWSVFAKRGMGGSAASVNSDDGQPTPSFASPLADNVAVTFAPTAVDRGNAAVAKAKVYVGDYEARVTPIADTDPGTALDATASFVPGTYRLVIQAPGFGVVHTTLTVVAGQPQTLMTGLPTNWASATNGAEASGDGVNTGNLIDDTEATNWASLGSAPGGKAVRVRLANGAHTITQVRVSALLHPADANNPNDTGSQSRFSALRQFAIETCDHTAGPCVFQRIYTSRADAFPGDIPRPLAPNLLVRTFDVPATRASDVRLVVLSNQCTGGPGYAGEQDNDPTNSTDCTTNSAQATNVRAAELEVLSSAVAPSSTAGASALSSAGTAGAGGAGGAAGAAAPGGANASPSAASAAGGVAGVKIALNRRVVGAGSVSRARIRVDVSAARSLLTWKQKGASFRALKLTGATFAAHSATLRGVALVNKQRVRFTAVVLDRGVRGDSFRLAWGGGRSHGGTLLSGGLTVR